MKNLSLEASQADAAAIHAMTDQQLDRHVMGQISVFRNIAPDKVLKEVAYAAWRWAHRAFEAMGLHAPPEPEKLATGQEDASSEASEDAIRGTLVPVPDDEDDPDVPANWPEATPAPRKNGEHA